MQVAFTFVLWTVAIAFAALVCITILGLLGQVRIPVGARKILYVKLVLELIGLGVVMFNQAVKPQPGWYRGVVMLGDPEGQAYDHVNGYSGKCFGVTFPVPYAQKPTVW